MKNIKIVLVILVLFFTSNLVFAQNEYEIINYKRISKVIDNPSYLVTPGDVFTLKFIMPPDISYTSVDFFIEGDYWTNLSFFGKIHVKGHSYGVLKERVENIIRHEYPKSFPQVFIKKTGDFTIDVEGEVQLSTEVPAWGFTKLSEVVKNVKTLYSSVRDITVKHEDGSVETFDSYQALYFSDKGSDPYLKRRDTVILKKRYGLVKINGEVHRPGAYEIFPETTLGDIKNLYNDIKPLADTDRIMVKRVLSDKNKFGETVYLTLDEIDSFILNDMDVVTFPKVTDYQPRVFFQGAIGTVDVSNKIPFTITPGDKLSFVARTIQKQFTIASDLENVSVTRKGSDESIDVNLEELLLYENAETDIVLQDGDTIIVPFRQYFVFVGGEVNNPGRFPFIENRTWEYYVGLAGGFHPQNHLGKKVKIRDVYGEEYDQDERIIQPEDMIYAPTNHPFYYVKEYGTDVALITTAIIGTATLIWKLSEIADGNAGSVLDSD